MKLLQLDIENYGIYTARHFDFEPGLLVIHGPNEAGKSTLLQLIRELLFGFPHQSPYVFQGHTGRLAATARVEMSDGRRIRFRRQKGRSGTVAGEVESSREPVDEHMLSTMLGGVSGQLYQNIFGFSLGELAAGEHSLRHARLTDALYGGGLGGLGRFQRVQQAVRDEHTSLFSGRAKKPVVNQLLSSIREYSKELRDATVHPRDYDELRTRCEESEADTDRLREELEQLHRRQLHTERIENALGVHAQLVAAREQLESLPIPDNFAPESVDEFRRLRAEFTTLNSELDRLESDLAVRTGDLKRLTLSPELLEQEATIRRLHQELPGTREFMELVPGHEQRVQAIKAQLRSRMEQLGPDWSAEQMDRIQVTLSGRGLVDELAGEFAELERRDTALQSQRPELDRQLTQARQRLEQLPDTTELPVLEDLLERSQVWQTSCDRSSDVRGRFTSVQSEIEAIARSLTAPMPELQERFRQPPAAARQSSPADLADTSDTPGTPAEAANRRCVDDLAALPVPLSATVGEFRDRLEDCHRSLEACRQRANEGERDLNHLEQELRDSSTRFTIIDRDQLLKQRGNRDAAWQLIRRHFIDEINDRTDSRNIPLPEEYERAVDAADQMADERQRNAEEVARREQLAAAIERSRSRTTRSQADLEKAEAELQRAELEWRELWADCDFEPLSPTAMQEWLCSHQELIARRQQLSLLEEEQCELIQRARDYESELALVAPAKADSTHAALADLRSRYEDLRNAAGEAKRLKESLPDLESRTKTLGQEFDRLASSRANWQSRWESALTELGLPASWSVSLATRILTDLTELRQQHGEARNLQDRVGDMRTQLDRFAREVREICEQVQTELRELPALDALSELNTRLDAAQQTRHDCTALQREIDLLNARRDVVRPRQEALQQRIDELFGRSGTDTHEELLQLADVVIARNQLMEEIRGCERDIRTLRGNDDAAPFVSMLESASVEDVEAEHQRLREQVERTDQAYRAAVESAAVLREQLKRLDSESRAIELSARVESLRSELGTAVDRWAPLVLAEALMQASIREFERHHQPQMLEEVSRLLGRMTGGRIVGLRRQLDNRETLIVEDCDGIQREPQELSTGTREQLYLAIRLAFVVHYCRTSEPLPIVMDDVLVNFDPYRARQTLEVLLELSNTAQILFLTCHDHMLELFRQLIPGGRPVELAAVAIEPGSPAADAAHDGPVVAPHGPVQPQSFHP